MVFIPLWNKSHINLNIYGILILLQQCVTIEIYFSCFKIWKESHCVIELHHKKLIFTMDDKSVKKLAYIAGYDGRTTEQEIKLMINEWIRAFEEACGEITEF